MPDPERFTLDVPGGTLHGATVGYGPALLVLHGGPGLNDYSETFLSELTGWWAITYHQRGPAPSSASGPFTVARHVADAVAVLDRLRVPETVVLGHSWGAFLACCLVAAAPERVTGLLLVDGMGIVSDAGLGEFSLQREQRSTPEVLARVAALEERLSAGTGTDDEALEAFVLMWPTYFADPTRSIPPPVSIRVHAQCSNETMQSVAGVLADGAVAAALASYCGPVEIVFGDASPMPSSNSLDTARLFPDAVTTGVAGAAHLPWVEAPGCLERALARLANRRSHR